MVGGRTDERSFETIPPLLTSFREIRFSIAIFELVLEAQACSSL